MSKSAIYTVNNSVQTLNDGEVINLGSTMRRFGCNCQLSGNAIRVAGAGYYKINASITIAPAAAATITITALKDGVAIPGAIASVTTTGSGDYASLPIDCIIRENCACCDDASNISFIVSGGATNVTNVAVVIEKI